MTRRDLAKAAASAALKVRLRAGIAITEPANPVDIAEKLGVQVWFERVASLEGVLIRAPHAVILLSALRPAGRVAFTCAHELGHHWFEHPGHVDTDGDDILLTDDDANEYQAHMFAAYLLMPKTTVQHAFTRRSTDPENATPRQLLVIAHWLGVGYATLINHLRWNLGLISRDRADALLHHTPKGIVGLVPHTADGGTVVLVDRAWRARPIDLEVGDVALVEGRVLVSGGCVNLQVDPAGHHTIVAVRPGTGHVDGGSDWSSYVRVRRHRYAGRSIFRHLEEVDDE